MPRLSVKGPRGLRPYLFHGLDLNWKDGDEEAWSDCPFCGRESKFFVNTETGQYQCKKCGDAGNVPVFLGKLWGLHNEAVDYADLADDRGLDHSDTLMAWGVCRSVIAGDWLIPAYNEEGKLQQLYKYVKTSERSLLIPTPEMGHKMFGVKLFGKKKSTVYLCEGPWDAMRLWEVLGQTKETEKGHVGTANRDRSLLADANVLAVPTCTVFAKEWCLLFADKTVVLCFDTDHPRKHPKTGKMIEPAGLAGMRRVAGILSSAKKPPSEILYHRWGEDGVDLNLPSGYDLRDLLKKE